MWIEEMEENGRKERSGIVEWEECEGFWIVSGWVDERVWEEEWMRMFEEVLIRRFGIEFWIYGLNEKYV